MDALVLAIPNAYFVAKAVLLGWGNAPGPPPRPVGERHSLPWFKHSGWDVHCCSHSSGSFPALRQLLWPAQKHVPGHTDPLGEPPAGTGSRDARRSRAALLDTSMSP